MHPLFGVPDLLEAVLEELDIPSLASMILTCRAFVEPAARVLYRDGGYAFMHMMREILHAETVKDADELLARPCWQRFKLYASFVRSLTLTTEVIGRSAFAQLGKAVPSATVVPNEPLFPHLRELRLEVFIPTQVPLLSVLLCPSLESLELLHLEHGSRMQRLLFQLSPELEILALLEDLPRRCPNLGALRIEEPAYFETQYRPTVFRMIQSLSSLQSFKAVQPDVACDPCLLEALSNLPRLHTLDVAVRTSVNEWTPPLLHANAFGALTELTLLSSAAQATVLLEMIPSPDLVELTVSDPQTIVEDVPKLVQACSRFLKLRHFTTQFVSDAEHVHDVGYPDTVVSWDLFTPMLQCSEIEAFVSFWDVEEPLLVMNDSDVLRLAQTWPSLKIFVFIPCRPPHLPALTFESINYLATYCPRLTGIGLPEMDATRNVPSKPPTMVPNANLSSLMIEDVRGDEEGVRRGIHAYWPNAKVIIVQSDVRKAEEEEGVQDSDSDD